MCVCCSAPSRYSADTHVQYYHFVLLEYLPDRIDQLAICSYDSDGGLFITLTSEGFIQQSRASINFTQHFDLGKNKADAADGRPDVVVESIPQVSICRDYKRASQACLRLSRML